MDELTKAHVISKNALDSYTVTRAQVLATMRAEGRHQMTNAEVRHLNHLHTTANQLYQAYWQIRTKVERNAD